MNVPCKDCKERHMRCHIDCEKYGQFVVENEKRKKFHREELILQEIEIQTHKRIRKLYLRKRGGGYKL